MRKLLGGAVLAVGVGGLGLWGANDHAARMQAEITQQAQAIVAEATHPLELKVSGRDISIAGLADTPQERGFLVASLNNIDGRRVVNEDLQVLTAQSPYATQAVKTADGVVSASGYAPSVAAQQALAGGEALTLASGAPDAWQGTVSAATKALEPLNFGGWELSDSTLSLSGEAATEAEREAALAALATLPEGVALTSQIAVALTEAEVSEQLLAAAQSLTAQAEHPLDVTVEGRVVTLSGPVASDVEKARLIAAAQALPNVDQVIDDMTVLPTMDPFVTAAGKVDADPIVMSGHVPTEAARAILAQSADATALTLANGAPVSWAGTVAGANTALQALDSGTWELRGTELTLTGGAFSAEAQETALAALAALPEGVTYTQTIELLDDGRPVGFLLDYSATNGTRVTGKLPFDTTVMEVARAAGLGAAAGDARPVPRDTGQKAQALDQLKALAPWLGQMEGAKLTYGASGASLEGVISPGAILSQVEANLAQVLPGVTLNLRRATAADFPPDGTTRYNAALQQDERFSGGYWLPLVDDFEPTALNCARRSEEALDNLRITFVTGEATLNTQSVNNLNRITALIRKCVTGGQLSVVLGGHTDSVGEEASNQALSQDRADAVRDAMVARGIPPEAITAVGYGETQPVASNDTEAGRAANRRTTIEWAQAQ